MARALFTAAPNRGNQEATSLNEYVPSDNHYAQRYHETLRMEEKAGGSRIWEVRISRKALKCLSASPVGSPTSLKTGCGDFIAGPLVVEIPHVRTTFSLRVGSPPGMAE